jgi:hypothetical protein
MSARSALGTKGRARTGKRVLLAWLVVAIVVLSTAIAWAFVYTNIVDFHLTETTQTYGTYTIASGTNGWASYRWLDDPDHTTVISGNNCSDLSLFGKATIPAHNTSYHGMFQGWAGLCFALRGRTAAGAGSMYYHDGRLER